MKMLSIMTASCLIMFGVAQSYAINEPADKDQKTDSSKAVKPDKKDKAQILCPVMGEEIDKSLYADVIGKRIYVCCDGCVRKIKADPAKYIKILEDHVVEIEKAPAAS